MSENWSQYAREVQAASDAGYRYQQKKIDALAKERDELRAALEKAASQVSDLAAKLGRSEGKLEASELPGVIDGWKARAEKAEAEVERLVAIIRCIDRFTPSADKTCDEPGISISEAVQRKWPSLRCAALQRKEGNE